MTKLGSLAIINDSLQINDEKHEKTGYLEQAQNKLELLKQNHASIITTLG